MRHGRQIGRNKSLDGTILNDEKVDIHADIDESELLGEKFERDKVILEKEMDKIEASDISASDKRALLEELEEAIEKLKREYEEQVTEEVEKLKEDAEENIERMQEAADKLKEQENSLRDIRLEAGSMDGSVAADAAAAEREKFERMRDDAVHEMELKMEQLEIQQRNMRAQRLRR